MSLWLEADNLSPDPDSPRGWRHPAPPLA